MPSLSKLIHRPKKEDAGPAPAAKAAEPPAAAAPESSAATADSTPMSVLKPQGQPEDAGSISAQLWDEAYDDLKSSEADLMAKFEKILSRELALQRAQATGASESAAEKSISQDNAIPQTNQKGIRQERLNMIIQAGLKKTAKIAKYEGHVKTAIDYVFKLKDIVDMAVSAMPAAAAAWSGISLGLQIFLNPLTSTEANRGGIVYVVTSMKWYYSMSNLILRENINVGAANGRSFSDLRSSMKARVLDLYKAIITYTTKSVVSYYRHQGLEFLRGLVQMDDWDGSLAAVKGAEEALRSDSTEYSTQAMRSTLDELLEVTKGQAEDLRSQLGDIHAAIEKQTATQLEWRMEDGDENCLRDLRVVDPRDEVRAIEARKDDLLDDAYKWILNTGEYKRFVDWDVKDDEQTRMLWIKGDAGTGKTMLMMGILRELEFRAKQIGDATTTYFFIQATDARLSNATTILRGLVWLLLDQRKSLISHIRDKYKTAGKVLFEDKNAFFALAEALKSILEDETAPRIILAVDALDECDEQSKPGLLDLVELLAEITQGSSKLKVLLSSRRGRAAIETKLNSIQEPKRVNLELDAALLTGPVNAYIDHKVLELGQNGYTQETQSSVTEILRTKANGTFLWVALVCKELEEVEGYDALEVLTEMPPGLKELYERMMTMINRLKRSDPGFCKAVLAAVMTAFRPLQLEELGPQAGLRANVPSATIVKKCGSFLTVRDDTVYFVHQSAKDYLVEEIYHGDIVDEHVKMTERAIDVLDPTLRRNISGLSSVGALAESVETSQIDPLSKAEYASMYWSDHLFESKPSDASTISRLCERVNRFFETKFLHWLEALSLLRQLSVGVSSLSKVKGFLGKTSKSNEALSLFVQDAQRFLLYHYPAIRTAPLQVYVSALIFTPTKSRVRDLYKDCEPRWILEKPDMREGWDPVLQTLDGLDWWVSATAVAPDGRVACCSRTRASTGIVLIWSASGDVIQSLEHDDVVQALTFLPDGRLATGTLDPVVRIWNKDGQIEQSLEGHYEAIRCLASTADGRILSAADDNTVRVWSVNGEEELVLEGHDDYVSSVAVLPDGRFVSGSEDETAIIWSTNGDIQHTLKGHDAIVTSVACNSAGIIATASRDKTIRLWNGDGKILSVLKGHTDYVYDITFLPDGTLASCSRDLTLRTWSTDGTCTGLIAGTGHYYTAVSASSSPDNPLLVVGGSGGGVRVLDAQAVIQGGIAKEAEGSQHGDLPTLIKFSPDRSLLVVIMASHVIQTWDMPTRKLTHSLGSRSDGQTTTEISLYTDGRLLGSCTGQGSENSVIRIWDTESGDELYRFDTHFSSTCAFSAESGNFALTEGFRAVLVDLETEDNSLQRDFPSASDWVKSIALSPDGKLMVGGGGSGKILVWNTETKEMAAELPSPNHSCLDLAWSPCGAYVSGRINTVPLHQICIWEVHSQQCWSFFKGEELPSDLPFDPYTEDYAYSDFSSTIVQHSRGKPDHPTFSINEDYTWIQRNGENAIFLPNDYLYLPWAAAGEHLAVGSASGQVAMFTFSKDLPET